MSDSTKDPYPPPGRAERVRRLLPVVQEPSSQRPLLPFHVDAIDGCLPRRGLSLGAVHEAAPRAGEDMPAAFGFVAALLARATARPGSLALLVTSRRAAAPFGQCYGHGLHHLGLDPARLLLAETEADQDALWALEEALRSRALAAVAGWIGTQLDLRASRRLQLAAGTSDALLVVLRPHDAESTNGAATRWRVTTAPAARDPFGGFERWRWQVALERCRNGRPGEWLMEWDHAAHRFGLVGALADHSLPDSTEPKPLGGRAG